MQFIKKLGKKGFSLITKISVKFSACLLFLIRTKSLPNLKKPKTFNEKTTWLKLFNYNDNELVAKCADKYEVREYISKKGYEGILTKIYGVYDSPSEIEWDKLPQKFAIKCTHGCAYNIICKDKTNIDKEEVNKKLKNWLKEVYGVPTTELHYKKIKPRIIIEEYLCDENDRMPIDYKIYCMNGKAKVVLVCSEREEKLKLNYYDLNWNEKKYAKDSWTGTKSIPKPENFEEMIKIAEELSKDFPFVRVDLYNERGKIVFGELTFTPACCCAEYYSKNGDVELGKLLDLINI